MKAYHKILIGGQPAAELREATASGAVTPGMLCEYDGDHDDEILQAHSEAGGISQCVVADLAPYSGDPRSDDSPIEDAYADGEGMKAFIPNPGNRCLLLLASGENVTADTPLVSAGDGHVAAYDEAEDDSAGVMFVARHAVDASAGVERIVAEKL